MEVQSGSPESVNLSAKVAVPVKLFYNINMLEGDNKENSRWGDDELKTTIEDLVYDRAGAPIWAERTLKPGGAKTSYQDNEFHTRHEESQSTRDILGVILPAGEKKEYGYSEFVLLGVDGSAIHIDLSGLSNPAAFSKKYSPQGEGEKLFPSIQKNRDLLVTSMVLSRFSSLPVKVLGDITDNPSQMAQTIEKAMDLALEEREKRLRNMAKGRNLILNQLKRYSSSGDSENREPSQ